MGFMIIYGDCGEVIQCMELPDTYYQKAAGKNQFIEVDAETFEQAKLNLGMVKNKVWVQIPPRPSPYHTYDYFLNTWQDKRALDECKIARWEYIKSLRDKKEFGGFTYLGNVYDSDQVSQGRILGAATAGVDQTWVLADNTTVELSASQLQQLYAALQTHIASVHERGRIARQLIFEAETKEQVEAVQL